jgi:hypothetical protein
MLFQLIGVVAIIGLIAVLVVMRKRDGAGVSKAKTSGSRI